MPLSPDSVTSTASDYLCTGAGLPGKVLSNNTAQRHYDCRSRGTFPVPPNLQQHPMNKPPIRILSNLARAGGTLVSRCLGSMKNTVLLSEIHPLGTRIFNPLDQAQSWYGMFRPEEIRGTHDFVTAIILVEDRCRQSGRNLVIATGLTSTLSVFPF